MDPITVTGLTRESPAIEATARARGLPPNQDRIGRQITCPRAAVGRGILFPRIKRKVLGGRGRGRQTHFGMGQDKRRSRVVTAALVATGTGAQQTARMVFSVSETIPIDL